MRRAKLDKIDRKILEGLQKDGRITNVKLAKKAGISAPPCLRRVRALEDAGYIKGYHADIDPATMGFSVTIFTMVKLSSHAENGLLNFQKNMKKWPMVRECYMLAGEEDFILKIVAKDWDAYQEFLTGDLTSSPNVDSVKSSMTIRTFKNEPGVPIETK